MKILGINFGHDSAVALIIDGRIVNAIEEEKISRVKQDFGWPEKAISVILDKNNLSPSEIDYIVFGGSFYNQLGENEIRYRFSKDVKHRNHEILNRITSYFNITTTKISDKNKLIFKDELIKKGFKNAQIEFYNHHLCHAITAYDCAPFKVDLVITADGQGDGQSFNFYKPNSKIV